MSSVDHLPELPRNPFKIDLVILFIVQTITASVAILKIVVTQRSRRNVIPFLEDLLLLLSLITAYSALAVIFVATWKHNLGIHTKDLGLPHFNDLVVNARLLFASALITIWTHGILRLSLLISVRRLYSPIQTRMQHVCDFLLFGQVAATIASTFWAIFVDPNHPSASWDLFSTIKFNADPVRATLGICIIGLIGDCFILMSPIPLVFMLKNLTARRRKQLIALLIFGFLTISVSVVRVAEGFHIRSSLMTDMTFYFPIFIIMSQVEVTLATITVSLPTASIFFRWVYEGQQRVVTSTRRNLPLRPYSSYITSIVGDDDTKTSTMTSTIVATPHMSPTNEFHPHEISTNIGTGSQIPESHSKNPLDTMNHQRLSSISKASSNITMVRHSNEIEDEEEDDDGNFFEMLVPSDRFYPAATVLKPRPPVV